MARYDELLGVGRRPAVVPPFPMFEGSTAEYGTRPMGGEEEGAGHEEGESPGEETTEHAGTGLLKEEAVHFYDTSGTNCGTCPYLEEGGHCEKKSPPEVASPSTSVCMLHPGLGAWAQEAKGEGEVGEAPEGEEKEPMELGKKGKAA